MDILLAVSGTLLLYLFFRLDAVRQATVVALYVFVLCLWIDSELSGWEGTLCLMVFAGGMLAAIAFIINTGTYSAEEDRYLPVTGPKDYLSDFMPFFAFGGALMVFAERSVVFVVGVETVESDSFTFAILTCCLLLALYAGTMLSKLTKY